MRFESPDSPLHILFALQDFLPDTLGDFFPFRLRLFRPGVRRVLAGLFGLVRFSVDRGIVLKRGRLFVLPVFVELLLQSTPDGFAFGLLPAASLLSFCLGFVVAPSSSTAS